MQTSHNTPDHFDTDIQLLFTFAVTVIRQIVFALAEMAKENTIINFEVFEKRIVLVDRARAQIKAN